MRFVLNTERLIKLNYILIIHVITANIALYGRVQCLIISWEKLNCLERKQSFL